MPSGEAVELEKKKKKKKKEKKKKKKKKKREKKRKKRRKGLKLTSCTVHMFLLDNNILRWVTGFERSSAPSRSAPFILTLCRPEG
jgi:transposase